MGTGHAAARERAALWGCGLLLAALLAIRIDAPWTYIHDDNGAWTQAVAGAHLHAGLAATRGQDFYQRRSDGALVPYLHHPPLYALFMAAVYAAAGHAGPLATRVPSALVHLAGYAGLCVLARRVFPASPARRVTAAFVYAVVPMSAFFGKLAFNEPLGLALCTWAVAFTAAHRERPRAWTLAAAGAAWTLAIAASWTATFLLGAFVALLAIEARRDAALRPAAGALGALALAGPLAVVAHLLWAGRGAPPPLATAGSHWGATSLSAGALLGALGSAFDLHRLYFANVPFACFLGWLVVRARRVARGAGLAPADRLLLAGALGAAAWALAFVRQVAMHAYGQFWFLPFESLAAADLALAAWERLAGRPTLRRSLAAVALLATLGSSAATLHYRYTHPHGYAIRMSRAIASAYVTASPGGARR